MSETKRRRPGDLPGYNHNITRQTGTHGLKVMTTKENPMTHGYGRLITFYCAKCGEYQAACYESDPARGGDICEDIHYCFKCGARIDFAEFYHKPTAAAIPTAEEEIKFE